MPSVVRKSRVKFFSCEIRCAGLRGMSGSTVERTARIVRTKTEAAAEAARTRGSRLVRTVTEDSIALEASRQAEAEVLQLHASTEVATPAAAAADHRFRARCSLSLANSQPRLHLACATASATRHRRRRSPPSPPLPPCRRPQESVKVAYRSTGLGIYAVVMRFAGMPLERLAMVLNSSQVPRAFN